MIDVIRIILYVSGAIMWVMIAYLAYQFKKGNFAL